MTLVPKKSSVRASYGLLRTHTAISCRAPLRRANFGDLLFERDPPEVGPIPGGAPAMTFSRCACARLLLGPAPAEPGQGPKSPGLVARGRPTPSSLDHWRRGPSVGPTCAAGCTRHDGEHAESAAEVRVSRGVSRARWVRVPSAADSTGENRWG